MSDWDKTRELRKERAHVGAVIGSTVVKFYDCQCVKCGMNYMLDAPPRSIPGAMSKKGFLCRKCRKGRLSK